MRYWKIVVCLWQQVWEEKQIIAQIDKNTRNVGWVRWSSWEDSLSIPFLYRLQLKVRLHSFRNSSNSVTDWAAGYCRHIRSAIRIFRRSNRFLQETFGHCYGRGGGSFVGRSLGLKWTDFCCWSSIRLCGTIGQDWTLIRWCWDWCWTGCWRCSVVESSWTNRISRQRLKKESNDHNCNSNGNDENRLMSETDVWSIWKNQSVSSLLTRCVIRSWAFGDVHRGSIDVPLR